MNFIPRKTTATLLQPLFRFLKTQNLGSKLLLFATILALVWANSPYQSIYDDVWHTYVGFTFGNYSLSNTLAHWINDGLMVIFFLVIGLEIKREILVGELSDWRKASLPLIAAAGGMIVPAALYLVLNAGGVGAHGWGIPMATDIAFALGCLMVLGKRIPISLKVFLLALAIVDDLGAILVIAFFYSSNVSFLALGIAALILLVLFTLNYLKVRHIAPYAILGFFLWLAVLQSGVHATLAGVLLALTIPSRSVYHREEFVFETQQILEEFPEEDFELMCVHEGQRSAIKNIGEAINKFDTPLQRLEDSLHPLSALFIIPLFALANAGVNFTGSAEAQSLTNSVTIGIILGLFIGKPVGIMLFSYLGIRSGFASLPADVNWKGIFGLSCLAGIGFTMSLFITNLAFASEVLIQQAKMGILFASLLSAGLGLFLLSQLPKQEPVCACVPDLSEINK